MKICVLSSGIGRFYGITCQLLKQQLIGVDGADFFAVFWRPLDMNGLDKFTNIFSGQISVYQENQFEFDGLDSVNKYPETNASNVLSMLYGRYLVSKKITDLGLWSKYDLFIYIRPDIAFGQIIGLRDYGGRMDLNDVVVPRNGHHRGGCNDQFCIAKPAAMKYYMDISLCVPQYLDSGIPLHPEILYNHHLSVSQVKARVAPIDNYIFRGEAQFQIG
jgi:hypothetical protein